MTLQKAKFIHIFKPHLFFDDKSYHLEHTSKMALSARVPSIEPDDLGLAGGIKP